MRIARLAGDRVAVRGDGGWWDVTDALGSRDTVTRSAR